MFAGRNRIAMMNEAPVFTDTNNITIGKDIMGGGFGDQCVVDISIGVDGSVWALACKDKTLTTTADN